MTRGFVVVWAGERVLVLTPLGTWSPDASDAKVFATWGMAKARSRPFKGADVVEAWV